MIVSTQVNYDSAALKVDIAVLREYATVALKYADADASPTLRYILLKHHC